MSVYIKSFTLPTLAQEEKGNPTPSAYPYGIFPFKALDLLNFEPITIFYGNNGSGKSTLLNVIAEKINLPRTTLFNASERFGPYVKLCRYESGEGDDERPLAIPPQSKIITSEDIFNHILTVRTENAQVDENKAQQKDAYYAAKYKKIKFNSLEDLDRLKTQNAARGQTCSAFVRARAGERSDQYSNGETALQYFNAQFEPQQLYLLDEPENSLSPKFQKKLSDLIVNCAYYCGCQFIIATHSPFILSLSDARIYDLDTSPVRKRDWYALENMRVYFSFFKKHERLFDDED